MSDKIYKIVTDKIITMLEEGTVPWQKPWNGSKDFPKNYISQKPYKGINTFLLHYASLQHNYKTPNWMTYKQISSLKGNVIKGSKSEFVIFWKVSEKKTGEFTANNTEIVKRFYMLRYYNVFNADQCEFPDEVKAKIYADVKDDEENVIHNCERIVKNYTEKPVIQYGGDKSSYLPTLDVVKIPRVNDFDRPESYYSTLFHELTHSTAHQKRLGRELDPRFGSVPYSKEELIAEMGAAFLCGHANIGEQVIDNSASYINGWLDMLKRDSNLVVSAASMAQKASDYILGE